MVTVAFCTTCKDRTQHLRITLPQNIDDNPRSKFVVLDYNSRDDLLAYLRAEHGDAIASGRLTVYSFRDAATYRMSHAKNMAHRVGILEGGDILVNLDADNMTGIGFGDFVKTALAGRRDAFLWANMIKGEMVRGISGRIAMSAHTFVKSGGYNEKFEGWSSDDKDMNLRLRMMGYDGTEIPAEYLLAVPHNDKMRFKEYPHLATQNDSYFAVEKWMINSAVANHGAFGCGVVYRNFDFNRPIHLTGLPTRIFGIGMHKTATTSLHHAWDALGYDSWHWSSAHAAKAIWRDMNNQGYSLFLERYYALCDLPIPMLYRQLDSAYPGSKFILTVRDEAGWLDAVRRHFNPMHNRWAEGWNQDPFTNRVHRLLYGRQDFDAEVFLERYQRHNDEVAKYFSDRPGDLLIMDMDNGSGWPELCGFLGVPVPDATYPRMNNGGQNEC